MKTSPEALKGITKQLSSDIYKYLKVFSYRSYRLYGKEYFCDVCIVQDINKDRVFIRLIKRWFGVTKKMKTSHIKVPRWIIVNSYNFPQKFEFEKARRIFEKISSGEIHSKDNISIGTGVSLAIEELGKLKNKIEKLEHKNKKGESTKRELLKLRGQVNFLDKENREMKKGLVKSNMPVYKKVLEDAAKELKAEGEGHFQKLFKNNHWVFGPNYEDVIPKKKADAENQPDFVLKRYDGFSDVVEIESPQKKLFRKPNKSGKTQPSAYLIQAISQAMDYIESYNSNYEKLFTKDVEKKVEIPMKPYNPQGIVIIGKDEETDKKRLRQLNHFLHDITVLTYNEFFQSAQKMLKLMEG